VPLQKATKGIMITQYEMAAIEELGLVKIDLLGSRALRGCIIECVNG
jgi:DNA polymerase III alpha subunit